MKKLVVLLLCFLSYSNSKDRTIVTKQQVASSNRILCSHKIEYYRLEIAHAVALLKKQKQLIAIELDKKERATILAIAFPEIIRYNSFSDYIETASNRILYINQGKKASDFSIGYFQMKPSFVEDLEKYIQKNKRLQRYNWILIQNKNTRETRRERIGRLENFQWQLRYLKVFWHIAEHKFKNISFKTKEDKIRFYATAYNYGFTQPEKEIIAYQTIKIFPYGKKSNRKKLAFADFSIDFIHTYSPIF